MKLSKYLQIIACSCFLTPTSSAALINDMQSCQGTLDAISALLDKTQIDYPADDVKVLRKGFDQYNQFIQDEIVTPGLIKLYHGDSSKTEEIQKMIDGYKANMVKAFQKRYHDNRLYMDHAVTINECTKKAIPTGDALQDLIAAYKSLEKLTYIK